MDRFNIIGVDISVANKDKCINELQMYLDKARGKYICAANVYTTVMARENDNYCKIQNNSYMTLPDGKPLSIVGKILGTKDIERVTGPEFMETILELSQSNNWTHYFYGNTEENINILIDFLMKTYPKLLICGHEPSIFRQLSDIEEEDLTDRIIQYNPDFVWVGIGAPLQEQFCAKLSDKTNSVWVGVGGAFNVIAGIIPRAPQWMQNCCLEWFYRLMKEPNRLFKRYLVTNIKFVYYLIKDKRV